MIQKNCSITIQVESDYTVNVLTIQSGCTTAPRVIFSKSPDSTVDSMEAAQRTPTASTVSVSDLEELVQSSPSHENGYALLSEVGLAFKMKYGKPDRPLKEFFADFPEKFEFTDTPAAGVRIKRQEKRDSIVTPVKAGSLLVLLFALVAATFARAADISPVETSNQFKRIESEGSENLYEFYGPLSAIYGGESNQFFDGSDTVHVVFKGELAGGKMANGFAEVEAVNTQTIYQGSVENGVMQDESAEVTIIHSDTSTEFYKGRFNGLDFDSCIYTNTGMAELYTGRKVHGAFNDTDAVFMGPLSRIYDGSFEEYAMESGFFDFEPIPFNENDEAIYFGPLNDGRVAGTGVLIVVHEGDSIFYHGQFENAKVHGIGDIAVGDLYAYSGHFADGQIAGLGEISSSHFSDMFTQSGLIPYESGELNIKGIWSGHTGLSKYFRATNESGDTVKLVFDEGEIKELSWLQKAGSWVSGLWFVGKLEEHHALFQKIITGAAIVDAGFCVSSLVVPASAPVAGPVCGVGFFTIAGLEALELTLLSFRAIDRQCYGDDCVEASWKDYGKAQLLNAAFVAMPFGVGKIGELATPFLKSAAGALKEGKYARAIASSKNAKVVAELEKMPKIEIPRSREIDIINDRLALKQAVVDYTGKNFREGFVEFFVRLKNSGREDLIKSIWNSHKTFIKESGIRAGGVHEWLEAENFVDYLVNPKWGKDGAYLAYMTTKMVQKTSNVAFKNGGAHQVYDAARGRFVPGPNSKSFHNRLGEKIAECTNKECVFRSVNEHAEKWLTGNAYKEYVGIEGAVLQ